MVTASRFGRAIWLHASRTLRGNRCSIARPVAEEVALCDETTFESIRLEVGFPWYGRDITDKNLPQEIGRDCLAISLMKGCYLGQETVARIDALGHVNKLLVSVRFATDAVPPAGAALRSGGVHVGDVTSAAYSPRLEASLALAYVRRGHEDRRDRTGLGLRNRRNRRATFEKLNASRSIAHDRCLTSSATGSASDSRWIRSRIRSRIRKKH